MGSMRMAASSVLLTCPSPTVCDLKRSQLTRVEDFLAFPGLAQAGHCLDEVACHFERVKSLVRKITDIVCLPIHSAYIHIRRLRNLWDKG